MKTVAEFENFTIFYDESVPAVGCQAFGHPKSSEYLRTAFKELIKTCERYGREHKNLGVLMDFRRAGGATTEDTEWVLSYVNPRIAESGAIKMALINPIDEFVQSSIKEWMDLPAIGNMKQRLFVDVESAISWLGVK